MYGNVCKLNLVCGLEDFASSGAPRAYLKMVVLEGKPLIKTFCSLIIYI